MTEETFLKAKQIVFELKTIEEQLKLLANRRGKFHTRISVNFKSDDDYVVEVPESKAEEIAEIIANHYEKSKVELNEKFRRL